MWEPPSVRNVQLVSKLCKCLRAEYTKETDTQANTSDGSNSVQTWSVVSASVGVQVCPAFSPRLDCAAKTALLSQRDEDIKAQRGAKEHRGVSLGPKGKEGGNMDMVMTVWLWFTRPAEMLRHIWAKMCLPIFVWKSHVTRDAGAAQWRNNVIEKLSCSTQIDKFL